MNRRLFFILPAFLTSLVLVPAAASAYVEPGVDFEVSDQTPQEGQTFDVTFSGAVVGEAYTLTITSTPASIPSGDIEIAGTAALTRTAASSIVSFDVTLRSPGSYYLALTDSSGALVADATVVVSGTSASRTTASASGGWLAATGVDASTLALGGAAIVLLGAGALVLSRRRTTRDG